MGEAETQGLRHIFRLNQARTIQRINRYAIPIYVVLTAYLAYYSDPLNFEEYRDAMLPGRIVSLILAAVAMVASYIPRADSRGEFFGFLWVFGTSLMAAHLSAAMNNHSSAQTLWILNNIIGLGLYPTPFRYSLLTFVVSFAHYFYAFFYLYEYTPNTDFQMTLINCGASGVLALVLKYVVRSSAQKELFARLKLEQANEKIATLNEQLKDENVRMAAELDVARRIQHIVLPDEDEYRIFGDLDIACTMVAADEVGGDYYDVLYFEPDGIIAIGDVTGHGLNSGIIMMMVHTALRALSEIERQDIVTLYSVINRVLYDFRIKTDDTRIMTLALLRYLGDGKFQMTGEHESFLRFRSNGEFEKVPVEFGMYAGLEREIDKHLKVHEFQVQAGETLILYTDGVTEAVDGEENEFGEEGITNAARPFLQESSRRVRDGIIMACRDHTAGTLYDDYSLVVIQRKRA